MKKETMRSAARLLLPLLALGPERLGALVIGDASRDDHAVEIISWDKSRREMSLPLGGTPGYWSDNLAKGKGLWSHKPTETKREVQRKYLEREMKRNPKRLIIFADRDVMWGGCSDYDIIERYNATVRDTGAPVVLGAQLGFWPPSVRPSTEASFTALKAKRDDVLRKHNLSDNAFSSFADCSDPDSQCSGDKTYSYVNSAFMMGPVDELLAQVKCMTEQDQTSEDDQDRVIACMFKNSGKIVMDYVSNLVLSTWEMKQGAITLETPLVRNAITGDVACFVHMNGNDDEGQSWYRRRFARESMVRDLDPAHGGVWWAGANLKR